MAERSYAKLISTGRPVRKFLHRTAVAFLIVAVSAASRAQAPAAKSTSQESISASRLAELIRFWNFVRLFHVDEQAMGPGWDAALVSAAEPAFRAPDDVALQSIASAMLGRIQPPPAYAARPRMTAAPAADLQQVRMIEGAPVASCRALAEAFANQSPMEPFRGEILRASLQRGLILDCRGFGEDAEGFQQRFAFSRWLGNVAPGLISETVERGFIRERFHDGFPPDVGTSSGGYARGLADKNLGRLEGLGKPEWAPKRLVFIFDQNSPEPWLVAGGLQAAGVAKVVAQGQMAEPGYELFTGRLLQLPVRTGNYVSPTEKLGFQADSCVPAAGADLAISAARALLAGTKAPPCRIDRPTPSTAAAGIATQTDPAGPLPFGQRMVALAKLWGTVEYFFPYRALTDQPWSSTLDEFVPIFAAATTREAYEQAVVQLTKRMDDSHAFVSGLRAHPLSSAFAPPIYVRPVGDGFAVAGLHDQDLSNRLRIGDELIAVDGQTVANVAYYWRAMSAASTEQAMKRQIAALLTSGPKNSQARLTIRRGQSAPFELSLPRSLSFWMASAKPKSQAPPFSRLLGGEAGYIDLERLSLADADRAIDTLMDTRAIIFDLRGYPQGTGWALAPRLALDDRQGAVAAQFRRPSYRGSSPPQHAWTAFEQNIPVSDKHRYGGRVIVLIDDRAISQSEHTALFLKAAAKPVFVGTPTTGANGDVTSLRLPGELRVSFTGHDVRHPSGDRLQRVGIQPDVRVEPTLQGLASGRDEVLEAGIGEALRP